MLVEPLWLTSNDHVRHLVTVLGWRRDYAGKALDGLTA